MTPWSWEAPGAVANAAAPTVWSVALDACPPAILSTAGDVLSEDEQRRAVTFRSPVDRRRFVASRLALRHILGHTTGVAPAALAFQTLTRGRPVLTETNGLSFNLAHTRGHLVIAAHPDAAVGVDIEGTTLRFSVHEVATHVLTARERDDLMAAPLAEQGALFIRYWTLKEAILKATGDGLYQSMLDLDLDLGASPPILRSVPSPYPPPSQWRLATWTAGANAIALAWFECDGKTVPANTLSS